MIDLLRKTVDQEIEILREIAIFSKRAESASPSEKVLLSESMNALRAIMLKSSSDFSEILNKIEISPRKEEKKEKKVIEKAKIKPVNLMPKIEEREKYLEELQITENVLKKIKTGKYTEKEKEKEKEIGFRKARGYLRYANKFFLESANSLVKKGYFSSLPTDLRKANLNMLFEGYVAMILFSVFLSFFLGLILTIALLLTGIIGILTAIWLPLIIPLAVLVVLYYYPSTEKSAISSRINEELPFAVIHMNSISGSGIAPVEIFKIIALSKEYPFLRKEIIKVLNQINIYGYDLVSALNNVSKNTSNQKLAELFAGISTTINSGGSLSSFFEKRSESLLGNYKLEKEKAIKIAETSMDIYISVVIAAPMILMLMLVMISVSGISIGFTPYQLTFLTIGGVALINIAFLGYLQTKRGLY